MKIKVAVNGYGTIGKRVADAIALQDDMEVVGVTKTKPDFDARIASNKFDLYLAKRENAELFEKAGIETCGTLEDWRRVRATILRRVSDPKGGHQRFDECNNA